MIEILPKEGNLTKSFNSCLKKFVIVDKSEYIDYIKESYSDLSSAEKEDNEKWVITKAYQSLFLMCNALLVKNLGYYSKDHALKEKEPTISLILQPSQRLLVIGKEYFLKKERCIKKSRNDKCGILANN